MLGELRPPIVIIEEAAEVGSAPMMIVGDFNGELQRFSELDNVLGNAAGWQDVGAVASL